MAITNTTPNYGLPLPTSGEIMDYTEFINDPMDKIDTAMHENAVNAAEAKESANTANAGVAAADEKISAIQGNLTEYDIPGLKTEVTSMDSRLEAVEETTMEFVNPQVTPVSNASSTSQGMLLIRSGGLVILPTFLHYASTDSITPTNGIEPYYKNIPTGSGDYFSKDVNLFEGNLFNLPKTNCAYDIGRYGMSITKPETVSVTYRNLAVLYDGVSTWLGLRHSTTGSDGVISGVVIAQGIY